MSNSTNDKSFWDQIRLAWQIFLDPETPFYLKLMPLIAVVYFFLPEGLAFWPFFTPLDDAAVGYVVLRSFLAVTPQHILAKYDGSQSLNVVDGEVVEVIDAAEPTDKEAEYQVDSDPDVHNWD